MKPTCLHKRRDAEKADSRVPRALIRRYIAVIITANRAIVGTYIRGMRAIYVLTPEYTYGERVGDVPRMRFPHFLRACIEHSRDFHGGYAYTFCAPELEESLLSVSSTPATKRLLYCALLGANIRIHLGNRRLFPVTDPLLRARM